MIFKNFQVGAIGASIEVIITEDGLPFNIATATSKKIRLTGPDGVSKDYAANFLTDGSDGGLVYTTLGDELYAPGYWQGQAIIILGSFDGPTAKFFFNVNDNLPTPP
jgi:hypothetical protein